MVGQLICVVAVTLGIDYGYRPWSEGGTEYLLQIEPEMLDSLREGNVIQSEVPPWVGDIRAYRITVGNEELPREPPRSAGETPHAEKTPSPAGTPMPGNTPASAETPPAGETSVPAANPLEPPSGAPPSGGASVPRGDHPAGLAPSDSVPDPPSLRFHNPRPTATPPWPGPQTMLAPADAPSTVADPPGLQPAEPSESPSAGPAGLPSAGDVFDPSLSAATSESETPPTDAEPDFLPVEPQRKPLEAEQAVFHSPGPGERDASENSKPSSSEPPPERSKPWLPLIATFCGLCASLGGNLYLSWLALGYRGRYQKLLRGQQGDITDFRHQQRAHHAERESQTENQ